MKLADLMIVLRADSAGLEKGMRKSERDVQRATANIKKGLASIGPMFAAGLGVAGFSAIAKKFINSTQTMGDEWTNTLTGMKTTTDTFFFSLASGDWSAFENGLSNALRLGREYAVLIDQLESRQISNSWIKGKWLPVYSEGINTARDTTLSPAERRAGYNEAYGALTEMAKASEKLYKDSYNVVNGFFMQRTGKSITSELLDQLYSRSIVGDDKELNDYLSTRKSLYNDKRYSKVVYGPRGDVKGVVTDKEAINSELTRIYGDRTEYLQLLSILTETNDEKLKANADLLESAAKEIQAIQGYRRAFVRVNKSISEAEAGVVDYSPLGNIDVSTEIDKTYDNVTKQITDSKGIAEQKFRDAIYELKEGLPEFELPIEVPAPIKIDVDTTSAEKELKGFNDKLSETMQSSFSNSMTSIAESVGESFVNGGQSITKSIQTVLADIVGDVGKMMIAYGASMEAVKKLLETSIGQLNPIAVIGTGMAMVGIAAAWRASIEKQTPALAKGGVAYGPTMALIGDNPNASIDPEVVAPLSKLRQMTGGLAATAPVVQLLGNWRISGSDLEFVLERNRQSLKRQRG